MSRHELVLLSPYRFPGAHALTLAEEDMACWLNAHSALWHPAVLWQAQGPPRVESAYDHETPKPGCLYAVPEVPPTYLPDDWRDRVRQAGSIAFTAAVDRDLTFANLCQAMTDDGAAPLGCRQALDLPADKVGPFLGLGYGHLLQATLAEAMEHENLLDAAAFWEEVQRAVASVVGLSMAATDHAADFGPSDHEAAGLPDDDAPRADRSIATDGESVAASANEGPQEIGRDVAAAPGDAEAWREHLQTAAVKLQSAREVLYPVTIHLLDLCLLDDPPPPIVMAVYDGDAPLSVPAAPPSGSTPVWPAALDFGIPVNFVASSSTLERLAATQPERFALLRERFQAEQVEICGGSYLEREDPYLPVDSQLWNIRRGVDVARRLLGTDLRVFARRRFGFHPQIPLWLSTHGLTKVLFLVWDEQAAVPSYTSPVVSWPSPDGKQVDAFVRPPKPAAAAETYFNLAHYWFKTTREDHAATVFLVHTGKPDPPWYRDLMELARLAPVFGEWQTFSRYFGEVMAGE
ncbi:MAG: hypothetical protein NZO58_02460, partial [Gemmataceae bacterium]|nr:hypothetical protein [Gemmataceae bacterium]